ncbi:MAG: Maf family nucleotide pyrophosphatase [Sulfuritalea sp.]|nr:Maf family nucleotide pyrophosphatase [Sulfuritalea sp.]
MSRLVVLASTSPFRRELLARLQIPFETAAPDVDESPLPDETPTQTARRLAEVKARAVVSRYPDALIIGSDQVAANASQRFGKPERRENAIEQLRLMRGKEVIFHTGLCLLNSADNRAQVCCVDTHVGFRDLTDGEIEAYLDKEDALNCAGSAKSEGLGISLLSFLRGDDPTALVGLPLIALCEMLRAEGLQLP